MSVRRAVIPAAGRGTRMLPVSRTTPKELLPLGETPVIDIVVRELLAAGLDELVVVTGPAKGAILEHLAETGVPVQAVEQPEPRGLGDAVLQAAPVIGREPFAVALPDALIPDGAVRELIAAVEAGADGAMLVEAVAVEDAHRYASVRVDGDGVITALVEKPTSVRDVTGTATAGRYVLPPAVFEALRATPPGVGGEVQLTDGIAALIGGGARIVAVPLPDGARRRDVGSPEGYREAVEDVLRARRPR